MFSIYLGKIGVSLYVKDIEPDRRHLYGSRAFLKREGFCLND